MFRKYVPDKSREPDYAAGDRVYVKNLLPIFTDRIATLREVIDWTTYKAEFDFGWVTLTRSISITNIDQSLSPPRLFKKGDWVMWKHKSEIRGQICRVSYGIQNDTHSYATFDYKNFLGQSMRIELVFSELEAICPPEPFIGELTYEIRKV